MSDTTTITQEKIQSWHERLTSEFSCFNAELGVRAGKPRNQNFITIKGE